MKFPDLSIRDKLILVILTGSFACVAIVLILLFFIEINDFNNNLKTDLNLNARVIGDYCAAPLDFGYTSAIEDAIEKVENVPFISHASVYDTSGHLLAVYDRKATNLKFPEDLPENVVVKRGDYYHYIQPITFKNREVGKLYIASDSSVEDIILNLIFSTAMAFIGMFMFSFLLALYLQRRISGPILMLEKATREVSATNDYSIRVNKVSNDEVGSLFDSFNHMITQISLKERERDIAHTKLQENEEKFRTVIEQSNDAIYILYKDKFELINSQFTKLTGVTEADLENPNLSLYDFIAPEDIPIIKKRDAMRESGQTPPSVFEFTAQHKDGRRARVQTSVTDIDYRGDRAILGIIRDVSEQKSLEAQLRQTQKIESIGNLAGGIAHDFNNLLTPIMGNAELAMMDLETTHPMYDTLREIHDTAERAAELTLQLLAFSRKQVLRVKVMDINKLIENFRKILRRTIREDIEIKIEYSPNPCMAKVDISQIEQILLNLLINAQDAMPSGGIISVQTDLMDFDDEFNISHPEVSPGRYVSLSVSDTGVGIDKDLLDKIFDPFFTTKAVDKGTGLGLSTVYGIVKQHDGHIWVYSEKGQGTTFKIYLPEESSEVSEVNTKSQSTEDLKGTGDILVVEDQEQVKMIAARILNSHGYTVHLASDGEEAVKIAEENNINIDLLLTDVIMPGMNGRQLYEKLQEKYPNLKVLYMSGYTRDVISHHGVLESGIDFIQKPLTVKALAGKVKEIIAGKS